MHIRPTASWSRADLREIWEHRELLYFLAWRDIKVRYRQTLLGVLWVVVQPVLLMVLFTIVFGRIVGIPSDGVPYPLFIFSALLPWTFFSRALSESSNSLVNNQHLVTKVYFPKVLIPLSGVVSCLVDFAISLVVFFLIAAAHGFGPGPAVVALPFMVLFAVFSATGLGVWLSALNVKYRDVRVLLPFLVQFLFFASPIAYPVSLVPERWRVLFALNPLARLIEGFRWSLLGTARPATSFLVTSALVVVALLVMGFVYFRNVERDFADVI